MKINVIATGSTGNLYELVDNSGNSIIIEAGMPRATFVKYRVGREPPEMCIISHKHMDHHQYWGEYAAITQTHIFKDRCESANWKAFGIPLKHGDGQTMTFIIKSLVENKFLFFGTDIEFEPQNLELFEALKYYNVENYLIECNYNDYLFHLATDEQRHGCSRHFSDNDVISFIRKVNPKNPKIITIHGSNRLSADTYTKKYLSSKLLNATVQVAVGAKNNQKNLFIL
jgi:Cft2 family RNA processing exonuclease